MSKNADRDSDNEISTFFKDIAIGLSATIGIFLLLIIIICIGYQIETMPDTSHTIRKFKDIDPKEFEGFGNISPNAEVCTGYCLDYSIGIQNEKGRAIHWGPFVLKDNLYFYQGLISIRYLNQPKNAVRIKEIKGKLCRTDEPMEFHRKNSNTTGYKYSDFKLYRCTLPNLVVTFDNIKYQLNNIDVSFGSSERYDDALEKIRKHFTSQTLTEIIHERHFHILTEDKKHRLTSTYYRLTVLNEQGNVLFVRDKLFSCDDDCFGTLSVEPINLATASIKLGQCEYPQGVIVYITNFKQTYADWYFDSIRENSIPVECQHQRLPYYIKEAEK